MSSHQQNKFLEVKGGKEKGSWKVPEAGFPEAEVLSHDTLQIMGIFHWMYVLLLLHNKKR